MMNSNNLIAKCAFSYTSSATLVLLMSSSLLASAILVQPNNYMLDDSPMIQQHDTSGSLSPFYNDAHNGAEQQSDKDIVNIIGDSLARLRLAKMLDQQQQQQQQQQQENQEGGQLSQEMADLISEQQQQQQQQAKQQEGQDQSLSSSVASMLMNVAQAAAAAASSPQSDDQIQAQGGDSHDSSSSSAAAAAQTIGGQSAARGPIMELDTTQPGGQSSASMPSKSDLKQAGPIQWYNPKETIPVLKISSMATPSKYKKVYFRSEKKLVDGAFHSPSGTELSEKKSSLAKPFASSQMAGVQRRSSRGHSVSSAPPSVLQDGVIDFLKKFRDVYVQTRPPGQSSPTNPLLSSVISVASPFAAILAPNGQRPNFASALSAAGQMVNSAAMLSQAASTSSSSGSSGSGASNAAAAAVGAAAASGTGASTNTNKSPISAQTYVSFWSKTFPTWVRKMLKQMRRRSLYNSSKRHQHQHQHAHGQTVSQKASGQVVDSPGASNSGGTSSMTSGSNSNSNSNSSSA